MSSAIEFDFSADVTIAGTHRAHQNWDRFLEHAKAEWSGDLDATMATMVPHQPFQVFHATGSRICGWQEVRDFYQERMQTFTGQGFFAQRWVVTDTVALGQGYFKGSPSGRFFGTMAYGKPLFFPLTLWLYFEDTLIKGEAAYSDGATLARQIREGATGDVRTPLY